GPARPLGGMPGAKPPDPDTLMGVRTEDYLDWADRQHVFASMAAVNGAAEYVLQRPDTDSEVVKGYGVTVSFFDVLRARPLLGATFSSGNAVAPSDRVVVVSHGLWQRHLARDPLAVGRTLALNGEPFTIVGVMPQGFAYPPGSSQPADVWTLWVPTPPDRVRGGARALGGPQIIARLGLNVSLDQAQARMSQVAGRGVGVRPLRDHLVGSSTRSWMLMLLAAVGIVLLIACANVANLWLARASVQQRDAAVRAALGASRGRLMQRVLIESLVVSVAGTIVGLALAWVSVRVLAAALPENLARVAAIGIDARVLAAAAVAALATGLGSGILPALPGSPPTLSTARRRREPRPASRPCGARRRRGGAGGRPARRRVALHRQLRQRHASRSRLPERPLADGAGFSAHESRIAAARSAAGVRRHRRTRAAVARRHRRRRRGARDSAARQPVGRCAGGAGPGARPEHEREREGGHRRLPPDAGDSPQERPVLQ